jgi:hypothetical protein
MAISPASTHVADANEIAESIASAVLEGDTPVFRTVEEDAAILAVWAYYETGGSMSRQPRPQSWDAIAGVSCGVWQQRCATLPSTIRASVTGVLVFRRDARPYRQQ